MKVCIIPAKFGSSRLPSKNFIEFHNGLNLTEILLMKLKKVPLDRIIVSCENKNKLEDLSCFCRLKQIQNVILHLRDQHLSKDPATIIDVVNSIIEDPEYFAPSEQIDKLIICLPTSPMIKVADITSVIDILERCKDQRILSISKNSKPPYNAWKYSENDPELTLVFPESKFATTQSTRCPETYMSNGAISGWNLSENKSLTRSSVIGYEMPAAQALDIDTVLDFEIAQFIFAKYFPVDEISFNEK